MSDTNPTQVDHAARALDMAKGKDDAHRPENTPAANEGMVSTPRPDQPPSGALDAEGQEPARRRGEER